MKKHVIILLALLGFGIASKAQMHFGNVVQKEAVAIGLKGGINLPRLLYFQNEPLSRLSQDWNITPMGGVFVEIPMGSSLIIAPEAVYVQRGTDISYEHFSGSKVHYTMKVSYADIRLPFEFRLPIKPFFQPYLTIGAEAGMRLFGQIHIDRTDPVAGLGIRSKFPIGRYDLVLKLSVTYHQGLIDSYSKSEKIGSVPSLNVNAYQITGYRLPQGIEACLGMAIPLHSRGEDACATFAKDRHRRHSSRGHLFGY